MRKGYVGNARSDIAHYAAAQAREYYAARTFQLISQMTKLGVLNPTWSEAANAIGPGRQRAYASV